MDLFTACRTRLMIVRPQCLHELDFVSRYTMIYTQNFVLHKAHGQSSNCCARWRMYSFGSSSIHCTSSLILRIIHQSKHDAKPIHSCSNYRSCWAIIFCLLFHAINILFSIILVLRLTGRTTFPLYNMHCDPLGWQQLHMMESYYIVLNSISIYSARQQTQR